MTSKKKTPPKKNNENKKTKQKIISSDKILLIVFCLLLILVITLFGIILQKKHEKETNPPANIVIPIYKEFTSYHFSISALGLAQKKDYLFKITNYRGKEINSDNIKYEIKIENDTNSTIDITKEKEKKNLMTDKKSSIIEGEIKSHKKGEDIYKVSMTSHKKLTDNDFIRIEITNKNIKEEEKSE